jgi:hypothetical protein
MRSTFAGFVIGLNCRRTRSRRGRMKVGRRRLRGYVKGWARILTRDLDELVKRLLRCEGLDFPRPSPLLF